MRDTRAAFRLNLTAILLGLIALALLLAPIVRKIADFGAGL
jgi:hypothetical protein